MVSEMAMEDVNALKQEGIDISPRDIIHLNALGVKAEKNSDFLNYYILPRCVLMKDGIVIRQPEIGHQLWIQKMLNIFTFNDTISSFTLQLFAMSRDVDDLPDWTKPEEAKKQMEQFMNEDAKHCTIQQLMTAVEYCVYGNNADDREFADKKEKDEARDPLDEITGDEEFSMEIGVVRNAQAMGIGITLAEAKHMTTSQVQGMIMDAYRKEGADINEMEKNNKNQHMAEYLQTLSNIRAKYTQVKNNG